MMKKISESRYKEIEEEVFVSIESDIQKATDNVLSQVDPKDLDPYITELIPALVIQISGLISDKSNEVIKNVLIELGLIENNNP